MKFKKLICTTLACGMALTASVSTFARGTYDEILYPVVVEQNIDGDRAMPRGANPPAGDTLRDLDNSDYAGYITALSGGRAALYTNSLFVTTSSSVSVTLSGDWIQTWNKDKNHGNIGIELHRNGKKVTGKSITPTGNSLSRKGVSLSKGSLGDKDQFYIKIINYGGLPMKNVDLSISAN